MDRFIERLKGAADKDTKVRAVLRRSLAFDPGAFPPAYPYVELFLKRDDNGWFRQVHYLVAGLWAAHWRDGVAAEPLSIGKACAKYQNDSNSSSAERRFIWLLDADEDQLPYRLRQMVSLLKEQPLDFDDLLKGLLRWRDDRKSTQNSWARDYYRYLDKEAE